MQARTEPQVPEGPLARTALRLSNVGIAAGFILLLVSGLLPESLLIVCAGSSIALALLSAAVLVSSASHARLRWKGASPALAIVLGVIIGALPGLLSGVWRRGEDHPVARTAAVRMTTSLRREAHSAATMPVVPQENVAVPAAPAGKPPAAALSELCYILDRKARPALDSLDRLLTSLADAPESTDPISLRSQLEPSLSELAQVAASLERIQSDNPDLSPQLREAIGSGRALSSLNSGLHQLTLYQGDARGYGASRLRRLANATEAASRWVESVDQQLAVRR
jgi:hypothetical protein